MTFDHEARGDEQGARQHTPVQPTTSTTTPDVKRRWLLTTGLASVAGLGLSSVASKFAPRGAEAAAPANPGLTLPYSGGVNSPVTAFAIGNSGTGGGIASGSAKGTGLLGLSGSTSSLSPDKPAGVWGDSAMGYGVYGSSKHRDGVRGISAATKYAGVSGINTGDGAGVYGASSGQAGVSALNSNPNGGYAVMASSQYGDGVYSVTLATSHSAIIGFDRSVGGGYGVFGSSSKGSGVHGFTDGDNQAGVIGVDASYNGGSGLYGISQNGVGIYGYTAADLVPAIQAGNTSPKGGPALYATALNGHGVQSITTGNGFAGVSGSDQSATGGMGLYGESKVAGGVGVYGYGDSAVKAPAGHFEGDVNVTGSISKAGGTFKIDHPQDPANKYLVHAFVESPEMKNVYDGVTTLNDQGTAAVQLPTWFETLNRDYRYQLTALGAPAPNLHVAQELTSAHFTIAGGLPGMRVSWQVTGIRRDPWAEANPITPEVEKPTHERGTYLHPALYGQPQERGIGWAHRATLATMVTRHK